MELLKGHMKNGILRGAKPTGGTNESLITRLAFILRVRVEILSRPVM